MITTPIPQTNLKNGQSPLDNTRPFMDDTGRLLSTRSGSTRFGSTVPVPSGKEVCANRATIDLLVAMRATEGSEFAYAKR